MIEQWREISGPHGATIRFTVAESGDPFVTLLCVHGWTLDHRSFLHQRALSHSGARVVSFDRRGFGHNDSVPGLDLEIDDLDALVDALPGPVVGFGVSQGARLLLRYAAQRPAKLAGLVLQGGLVDGLSVKGPKLPFARYASLLEAGDRDTFIREWLAHPLMSEGVPEEQKAGIAKLLDRYEGKDLLSNCCAPAPMDVTSLLPTLSMPMAVVDAASESPERREHARFLIDQCGAAALSMPGGHLCHFTHPAECNAAIADWLSSSVNGVNRRQERGRGF